MRGALIFLFSLGFAIVVGTALFVHPKKPTQDRERVPTPSVAIEKKDMKLESSAFINNTAIPSQYSCDGQNGSPPLTITDIPKGTKSLALIVDDPDAPAGTWVHWLLWNITSDTKDITQGGVPAGATEGTTSFGKPGYGGPCPPIGTHHYVFTLYALDISLNLPSSAKKSDLESAMTDHILTQSELVGLYNRK